MFNLLKRVKVEKHAEENALCGAICEIERKIAAVRSLFSSVDNDDLIEAYVFELGSLEAKRSFLLKRAKEMGISKYPFVAGKYNETA